MNSKQANKNFCEGEIKNIVFRNDSGSFTVARFIKPEGGIGTAVGSLAGVQPGEIVRMHGQWIQDQKFGQQFKVESYTTQPPNTVVGLERYLASGILPGVGEKTAERIVAAFGEQTLSVLNSEPERLQEISGLGSQKVDTIVEAWQSHQQIHDVMVFLQASGISAAFANRIYRLYGDQAIGVLKSNPYRLAWEVPGIGFKKADKIARGMGVDAASPERCGAGVIYLLRTHAEQGHVLYPLDRLLQEAVELLGVDEDAIGIGIQREVNDGHLVFDLIDWLDEESNRLRKGQVLYLGALYRAECGTATELARLIGQREDLAVCDSEQDLDHSLQEVVKHYDLELGNEQNQALRQCLMNHVSVITGGPGTGKTTMIRALVHILQTKSKNVLLAAPTGRAAKRLSEASGMPAKTIHRLLEYRPGEKRFVRDQENPLDCDYLIIDEASMIDIFLIYDVLKAVPDHACLLLVGDCDQLPSVGSGNVLRDFIDCKQLTVSVLKQIYRQAGSSLITVNAHAVNSGRFPKLIAFDHDEEESDPEELVVNYDCFFVQENYPIRVLETIKDLCAKELPQRFQINSIEDIQVITPMHRGDLGSMNLNRVLQETLNPRGQEIRRGDKAFRLGDRVMQIRNNYDKDVYNGDIGTVLEIDADAEEITVRFDHTYAGYNFKELDKMELAYAITVHKSQGSEYPVVVLPLTTQHFVMLQRNLLYTALTRGRMLVVLVGSTKALAMAIKNDHMARRFSYLSQRVQQLLSKTSPSSVQSASDR